MNYLSFEEPLIALDEKMQELVSTDETALDENLVEQLKKELESKQREVYSELTAWQRVELSRHLDRPQTTYYIQQICEDFVELHGDRHFMDDPAIVGGFGTVNGKSVMIIGQEKGDNTKSRQFRNFGMPKPEGYRKALRLMKLAEKFNKPIITFIDTPGAYPGIGAEERGQAEAIARNLFEMVDLQVPVLCYVIGEGASGGAVGIGVGDRIFMLENTWFSVISPESCSSILWRNWDNKKLAADCLKLTAEDMLGNGLIDGIVPEPLGGAHRNKEEMAERLRVHIQENLSALLKVSKTKRVSDRIEKFESFGKFDMV